MNTIAVIIAIIIVYKILETKVEAEIMTNDKIIDIYGLIILSNGIKNNIDPAVIASIIRTESSGNPQAIRNEKNSKGEVWDRSLGLMQLLTGTAGWIIDQGWGKTAKYSGNPSELFDPEINIELGTLYISYQFKRYGNIKDAIAAYNAGSCFRDGIDCIKQKSGLYTNSKGVPNVQNYFEKVVSYIPYYRKLFSNFEDYKWKDKNTI